MPSPQRSDHRSRVARVCAAVSSVLIAVTGALVVLGTTATPAQAVFDTSQQWGYAKVTEPEAYLRQYVHKGIEIVHVDEEHMTADGFWFAYGGSRTPERDFIWQYQPFGAWCNDTTLTLQWNPWLNTHQCRPDPALTEAEYPGTAERDAACREATGQPWKRGNIFPDPNPNDPYCGNTHLVAYYVQQDPGMGHTCAPWEDQGVTKSGSATCLSQRYSWENTTPNTYWSPAPDACTGLPAEATIRYVNPDLYVPAGPVPGCTGAPLATNCPPESTRQACTGVPQVILTATATVSVTVTDGTATASATKSATSTAAVHRVTKTVKQRYKGKIYKATKTVKIVRTASQSATASVTLTDGSGTASNTQSCSGRTVAAAQACAEAAARALADAQAREVAVADAATRAKAAAAKAATAQAHAAAYQSASSSPVTKDAKKAAAAKAKRQALKDVTKQIQKAKKRR